MENLKLKAEEIEDVTIMSAYLQDAITMMGDVVYQQGSRQFVMMLNRYVWESRCPDSGRLIDESEQVKETACSRIRTGLHFNDIIKINSQNINTTLKKHPLELLSIEAYNTKDETFQIDFIFSGQGIIRLECEIISAHMQDIGQPWPAKCHPKHEILDVL